MVTVYLTNQPLSGALRARAVYHIVGTLLGAVAMMVIVPNLVDSPELTSVAISPGLPSPLRLAGRHAARPRICNLGFILPPWSAAVFDTAIAPMEEIMFGTVCAALVHSGVLSVLLAKQSAVQRRGAGLRTD
jgi:uncharacterized membrane protein YccC